MKKTLNALIATALTCNMMGTSQGMEFPAWGNNTQCTRQTPCMIAQDPTTGLWELII